MNSTNLALAVAGAFCWLPSPADLRQPNRITTTTAAQVYPSKHRVKPSLQPPLSSGCSIATALKLRLQVRLTLGHPK
ncbi:MAG: hypothetical protein AAGE59_38150 [Cyanobacteria bacterium P01_F01_bin.86]